MTGKLLFGSIGILIGIIATVAYIDNRKRDEQDSYNFGSYKGYGRYRWENH